MDSSEGDQDSQGASDNPALTTSIPAVQRLPVVARSRSNGTAEQAPTPSSASSGETKGFQIQSKYEVGWRRIVRNFSPSWFSVSMGTGIVSLLLVAIPYHARWLYWTSVFFFCLNVILFTATFAISLFRYAAYPDIFHVMLADRTNSLFLGTIPMGFATLIEAWVFLCVPYWGHWAITFAWVCWMIDSVVAISVTIFLTILLISSPYQQGLDRITAAQLLPISATTVAAGTGAEISRVLPNQEKALVTLIICYVMWGMSVPLAMSVLVMYYQRLALHKLPPREVIVSSFLPLSPLGMGGYTIMYLGSVAHTVFPQTQFFEILPMAGEVVHIMGIFIALVMWGFGLTWLCFALATIYKSRPFPFNMGWWGFTFPLGVFTISTIEFGHQMPSRFFKVLGTVFSVAVILLWCVVTIGTIRGVIDGRLFEAPCLVNLPKKDDDLHDTDNESAPR